MALVTFKDKNTDNDKNIEGKKYRNVDIISISIKIQKQWHKFIRKYEKI